MFLLQKLAFKVKQWSIWKLAQAFADGTIVRIPQAQRKVQEGPWQMTDNLRIKDWLYSFFCLGTNKLQSFTIVKLDVFVAGLERKKVEIENMLCTVEKSFFLSDKERTQNIKKIKAHREQLNKRIDFISKHGLCRKAKWILIDGQNRLFYAVLRFFFGINLLTGKTDDWQIYSHADPIVFQDEETDKRHTKNKFYFKDLTKAQQDCLKVTPAIVNIGTKGEAEDFINALIDINDGVPWDAFTKIIQDITKPMVGHLHDIYAFDKWPLSVALFKITKKMSSNYSLDKHGNLRIIVELMHMLKKGIYGSVTNLQDNVLEYCTATYDDTEKSFRTVMKYLDFISLALNAPEVVAKKKASIDFNKEQLRCLCQLFMILEGHRSDAYTTLSDIVLDGEKEKFFGNVNELKFNINQIERPTDFIKTFIKWHDKQCDYTLNENDFAKDDDGNTINETLPNTYFWSVGQSGINGTKAKEAGLLDFIRECWSAMRKNGCISAMVEVRGKRKMPSKAAIAASTDFKDPYAEENIQVIDSLSEYDKEHLRSIKKKGRSSIGNSALTTDGANKSKAAK